MDFNEFRWESRGDGIDDVRFIALSSLRAEADAINRVATGKLFPRSFVQLH